jgi:hypothetical protein
MFQNNNFNGSISGWNVSSVVTMDDMFESRRQIQGDIFMGHPVFN